MKRFVINLILFLGFSAVFYVAFLIIFGSLVPNKLNKNLPYKLGGNGFLFTRLKEADTVRNIDVLFLGSSHAYRGYDPSIFQEHGFKTFNLGSSAQTPLQTELLLDRYLDALNPRLIILDVYPVLFNADGVESTLDFIANAKMDKDLLGLSLNANNIKIYNTLIYAYYRKAFSLNKDFREKLKTKGDIYMPGGYVQTDKTIGNVKKYKRGEYEIDPGQLKAFERIIDRFKKLKKNYVIVQAPILPERYNSVANNKYMDSLLATFGPYYNFNSIGEGWPDSLFADDSHLNKKGVALYNARLFSYINIDSTAAKSL